MKPGWKVERCFLREESGRQGEAAARAPQPAAASGNFGCAVGAAGGAPQPELFTCFGVKTTGKLQVDQRSRKCFSKMSQVAAETSVQLGTEQRVTPASLETGTQQTVPSLALTL